MTNVNADQLEAAQRSLDIDRAATEQLGSHQAVTLILLVIAVGVMGFQNIWLQAVHWLAITACLVSAIVQLIRGRRLRRGMPMSAAAAQDLIEAARE